ncbi:MAG: beta-galactosidase trimerization domain-containing protein, partial [Candidatus Omnitrophica bacterium]|nr:beta-galactosidase trimerization domain-containing protein [Candidatus Omnitrophota bacterium]
DTFVKNGGGLLVALPPEDATTIYLKDILPVDITDGKTIKVDKQTLIRPEVINNNHPALSGIDWKPYPGSLIYYKVKLKEGADILIRWNNGDPALIVWNVGKGKVAYFSAPLRTDFGQIYLSNEFHDYWLFLIRLSYWLSGNEEYTGTLGFLGKSHRERDRLMDRLAYIRTLSEDIMALSNIAGKDDNKEEIVSIIKKLYSSLEQADTLLANALFKEAFNLYHNLLKEIDTIEERYKCLYETLKETLLQKGFNNVEVKKGIPVQWGQHGILQYSNTEETNNSAIRQYSIGVYLDTIQKLGMNTFVQGGGTNRFIKKGADPSTVEEADLQLDIYDDYIREAKKRGISFYIHLDGRESIHDNFDGNYDYLHQGFIDKLPYPEKRGRAKGAESHPFNRYNEQVLSRYNSVLRLIANRYKDEPTVAGYNTDNETHNLYWKTEEAREKFQKWLMDKYGSLERINKTLGYNFSCLQEINIPEENKIKEERQASSPLKALWYEWKEFENWISWRYFYQYKDAIKSVSPGKKLMDRFSPNYAIGHGTYNPYGDIPYDEITSIHDITGLHIGRDFNLDYMAGYAGNAQLGLSEYYPLVWDGPYKASFRLLPGLGGPWAVPEMKDEIDNYAAYIRNFWLVFSRGVEVILDHAMGNGSNFLPDELSHSNPYGFGYFRYGVYGMKWVNSIYTSIRGEIDGSNPLLPVAIMEPNESRIQTISSPIEDDLELLPRESNAIYNILCRPLFFTPDVIPTSKDISNYKVIIVPYSLYIKEQTQKKLENFVKEGGILLATGPIGLYNELSYPSMLLLKNLWGINNVVKDTMPAGKIKFSDGTEISSPSINKRWLFENIDNQATKVIARYADGKPAILESVYGKGKAFIIGWPFRSSSNPEDILRKTVLNYLPEIIQCSKPEVYIYPRIKDNDLILFVVNRLFERQNIVISLSKQSEIIDLRLGIGWEGNTINCDMLPGEGRVFKIKNYFLH